MNRATGRRHSVRDWVDSNFYDPDLQPERSYEKTHVLCRDPHELLDGCVTREIDIELDTVPAELMELFKK